MLSLPIVEFGVALVGRMDDRGLLTITGRLKELIIRGGESIAPAEIESCLLGPEAVLEAAVVGVPDEQWGEVVRRGRADPRRRARTPDLSSAGERQTSVDRK